MKAAWQNLGTRDRLTLVGGSIAALVLLGYAFLWQPVVSENEQLRTAVAKKRQDLAWLTQAAPEIRRLQSHLTPAPETRASLLSLLDSSARAQGLGDAVQRIDPQRNEEVRVSLKDAEFDRAIRWLKQLSGQGLTVVGFSANRGKTAGVADISVTFRRT